MWDFPAVQECISCKPILDVADLKRCLCCCVVWPAGARHRRGKITNNVDARAPVGELMGNTWNICFHNINSLLRRLTTVNVTVYLIVIQGWG